MPVTFMYKYTDEADLKIRRFVASQLMSENEFLRTHDLATCTFAKMRRTHKISRPMIARLMALGVDFSKVKFELYE